MLPVCCHESFTLLSENEKPPVTVKWKHCRMNAPLLYGKYFMMYLIATFNEDWIFENVAKYRTYLAFCRSERMIAFIAPK